MKRNFFKKKNYPISSKNHLFSLRTDTELVPLLPHDHLDTVRGDEGLLLHHSVVCKGSQILPATPGLLTIALSSPIFQPSWPAWGWQTCAILVTPEP